MAEAFGVTSGAISIVAFAMDSTKDILWYYGAWKNQGEDVKEMLASVNGLNGTLEILLENIEAPASFPKNIVENVENSIESFRNNCNKLHDELKKVQETGPPKAGVPSKIRLEMRKLMYPLKEATLVKIRGVISEARSNLSLALDALKIDSDKHIRYHVEVIVRKQEDEETQKIVDWLSPLNFWPKQADVFREKQYGTGQWLLDDPVFLKWANGNEETIWCRGGPGVGKTVLASTVIDFLETNLPIPDVGLSFVYCSYKEQSNQTVQNLIASIVRQLVEQRPTVSNNVRTLYQEHYGKRTRPSCAQYLGLLQSLSKECSEVYVVVDALDECEEHTWSGFLTALKDSIPNLHLLCTSRHVDDNRGNFASSRNIEIRASDADIKTYILAQIEVTDRLLGFCKKNETFRDEILKIIVQKAQGMFLIAQLHVNSLAKETNVKASRKALQNLPESLDNIYDEAMVRIQAQHPKESDLALRLLCWIIYATRPLQVEELQHAMAVKDLDPTDRFVDEDCLTDKGILVNVCAGLITVDEESNVIRLVHYTTQEYFKQSGSKHFLNAQESIAAICLTYLSLDIFGDGFCLSDEGFKARLQQNALFDYAARNWSYHTCGKAENIIQDLTLKFLLDDSKVASASQVLFTSEYPFPGYSQIVPQQFSGMHLVAWLGLKDIIVKMLWHKDIDLDFKDTYKRTALSLATVGGHEVVVRLLLEKGANVESKDDSGWTALLRAANGGHKVIVQLLLEKGADVEVKDNYKWTALLRAIEGRHKVVVQLLLEKGANVEAKDIYGRTALWWAADRRHEAEVELLEITKQS